jgi:hypothetical protein
MELSLISDPIVMSYYRFLGPLDTVTFKFLGMLCRNSSMSWPVIMNYSKTLFPIDGTTLK